MISSTPSKYFVATSAYLPPLLAILLSLGIIYFLFFSSFFKIKRVECVQDVGEPCQNDFILAELDRFVGLNLFLANTNDSRTRQLQGDPTVRALDYQKILPATLVLTIQSVYPTLALTATGADQYLTLDSEFRLIKVTSTPPNVPVVRLPTPLTLRLGQRIEEAKLRAHLAAALKLATELPGTTNFSIQDSDLLAVLEDKTTRALFTLERDLEAQISALHATRTGVTISLSSPVIDVRFTQPIIKDGSSL